MYFYSKKLMIVVLSTALISVSFQAFSSSSSKEYMLNNGAYVQIDISSTHNNKAELEVKMPIMNAYGNDGKSQKPEEQNIRNDIDNYLKNNISAIVSFDKDLACKYEFKKFEHDEQDKEIEVKFNLICKSDLHGKKVNFDFSNKFKNIQKIYYELEGKHEVKNSLSQNKGNAIIQ